MPPRNVTPLRPVAPPRRDPADPVIQMEAVHRSEFRKIRLLNKEEARLLPVIERTLRDIGGGHRVMAQTSLGEVISPVSMGTNDRTAEQAFASINSKRLDFALIDRFGMLALAVEYQGSGHYQGRAFMRDAVKKEALRKAGVPTLEVMPDFDPDSLADQIRRALVTPAPDASG